MNIRQTIKKVLLEEISRSNIKQELIDRIPFLKEYKIFKHPRDNKRLEAQRVVYNSNVNLMLGDEALNFPQFNVSSEIFYYPNTIHDNTFHNFIIKNEFHPMLPKEMDDLTFRAFSIMIKQLEKKFSYNKEYVVKLGEEIPKEDLDVIINEMNGTLFNVEEFTNKYNINLF